MRNGITAWVAGWVRQGWRTASNQEVKNRDLWARPMDARDRHEVEFLWVRGHAGDPLNGRADHLADQGMIEAKLGRS